jgi:ComF family protein
MAKEILFKLRIGRNIISTVNIDINKVTKKGKKKIGDFVYIPILELTPKFLYQYAYKNHKKGKEGQTIIIIDECQILFNPRDYRDKDRSEWILFFTKHRHLGYNIIMTSQFDRLVDRQIRSLFEYEIKHRKVNNYGLLFLLPLTIFACIEYWYGNKMVVSRGFMIFNKKTASIYDSYVMYDEFAEMMANEGLNKNDCYYMYEYEDIKKDLYKMKYGNLKEVAEECGRRLAERVRVASDTILVPVPMHPDKETKRGFNQAEVIANEISKVHDVKVEKLLKKVVSGIDTARLSVQVRKELIKTMYGIDETAEVEGKRIVLVDDVITTGETVKTCKKLLEDAGTKEVKILTLAKTEKRTSKEPVTSIKKDDVLVISTDACGDSEKEDAECVTNSKLFPKNITNKNVRIHLHPASAAAQVGVRGSLPARPRPGVNWWTKPLFSASIKGRKKTLKGSTVLRPTEISVK